MKKIIAITMLIVVQILLSKGIKFTETSKDNNVYTDESINRMVYSTLVIRKSRQTNPNDPLNQGADRLRNEISNFSDSFRKESSASQSTVNRPNSNQKIANLENEIQKVKEEIEHLKTAPNIDSSSKTKFTSLESAIGTLQRLFDDNKKVSDRQMENLENTIDSLTASVSEYRRGLENLKTLMDEKDKAEKERGMPAEIVQDIQDGECSTALTKLLSLTGDFRRNADHVVRTANIKHGNTFGRMTDFAESLRKDSEKTLKFFEALKDEMESVHFDDVVQILKLANSVKYTLVINYADDVPYQRKTEAKTLMENLRNTARDIATRKLEDAMMTDSYRSVSDLCDKIIVEDSTSLRDVLRQAIGKVINRIDAEKLVNFMMEHKYISQRIYGYSAIFNELKATNRLDDRAIVFLAYGLKNVMDMNTYQYTSIDAIDAAEDVRDALPKSVRNLAFSKRVCIKNRFLQERLFAGDYQSFDESRRRVSTWIPGTRVSRDEWIVFPVEYVFFIKSYSLGEYLYAADDNHKLDQSRRRVLTWIPGDRVKQGRWSIEPNGDDVYIRNYIHNEYLYADYITHANDRTVYTWGSGSKPSNSLWTIEDCG